MIELKKTYTKTNWDEKWFIRTLYFDVDLLNSLELDEVI